MIYLRPPHNRSSPLQAIKANTIQSHPIRSDQWIDCRDAAALALYPVVGAARVGQEVVIKVHPTSLNRFTFNQINQSATSPRHQLGRNFLAQSCFAASIQLGPTEDQQQEDKSSNKMKRRSSGAGNCHWREGVSFGLQLRIDHCRPAETTC